MYIGRGNRNSRRKPVPAPLLSITKSHMTRPGFEPGPLRKELKCPYYKCFYLKAALCFVWSLCYFVWCVLL
jgi:hypothetical protein